MIFLFLFKKRYTNYHLKKETKLYFENFGVQFIIYYLLVFKIYKLLFLFLFYYFNF